MLLATPGAMRLVVIPAPDGADVFQGAIVGARAALACLAASEFERVLAVHVGPLVGQGDVQVMGGACGEGAPAGDGGRATLHKTAAGRPAGMLCKVTGVVGVGAGVSAGLALSAVQPGRGAQVDRLVCRTSHGAAFATAAGEGSFAAPLLRDSQDALRRVRCSLEIVFESSEPLALGDPTSGRWEQDSPPPSSGGKSQEAPLAAGARPLGAPSDGGHPGPLLVDQHVVDAIRLERQSAEAACVGGRRLSSDTTREPRFSDMRVDVPGQEPDDDDMGTSTGIVFCPVLWGHMFVPLVPPENIYLICWHLVSLLLILYLVFSMPIQLAFDAQPEGFLYFLSVTIDVFFMCDLALNFFVAYRDADGKVVLEPLAVVCNYVRTSFALDLLASIPFDLILDDGSDMQVLKGVRVVRVLRILRLVRLLRISKSNSFKRQLDVVIESSRILVFVQGVMGLLICLFGVTHWAACCWYVVGTLDDGQTWIKEKLNGITSWQEQYVYSFYFTLTTIHRLRALLHRHSCCRAPPGGRRGRRGRAPPHLGAGPRGSDRPGSTSVAAGPVQSAAAAPRMVDWA
ncbi:unnamed protein product [Prorocentrum cordatum]|uniref:Ion transport domain-containing protein n=1 Tax=Prorocentrum cordatum TaxID=2364126 RepID=A0ABN9TVX3_9DINO|nr:unnamed protein product [Polarella glacialis]